MAFRAYRSDQERPFFWQLLKIIDSSLLHARLQRSRETEDNINWHILEASKPPLINPMHGSSEDIQMGCRALAAPFCQIQVGNGKTTHCVAFEGWSIIQSASCKAFDFGIVEHLLEKACLMKTGYLLQNRSVLLVPK